MSKELWDGFPAQPKGHLRTLNLQGVGQEHEDGVELRDSVVRSPRGSGEVIHEPVRPLE